MKHGCVVVTLRISSSRRSGSRQFHRGRKKARQVGSIVKTMLIVSSTSEALSTRNSYSLVKPSMANFTEMLCSGWGRALGPDVQRNGRTATGFSTMTTRPLTHHLFSVDNKTLLYVTFCILYFSSNNCSTCFGQPRAHHQQLTTAWYYSLVFVCAVAAGRLSRPVGR